MEVHVTIRYWMAGALVVLLLLGASWSVFLYRELSKRSCSDCLGYGSYQNELGVTTFCGRCGGSGRGITMTQLGNRLLGMILEARQELLWRMSNRPLDAGIYGGCLFSLVALAALVRVVDCRRCAGKGFQQARAGTLRQSRRVIEIECPVCAGRGRATTIDQLVSRV